MNRKVEAIKNIKPPTSQKEVQKFIGVIKYYRYVWPRRSHTSAPLTKLMPIKRKFGYTEVKKDAFDEIKRILARDNLLTYPDFNEIFIILTDVSVFQLVAVIIQKGKHIPCYSKKLTYSQQQYAVT